MKALLKYLSKAAIALVMAVSAAFSCTDYESQIQEIGRQLEELEKARTASERGAEELSALIEALQAEDELVGFSPVSEEGTVKGFRVTFKEAGEVVVYNREANVTVGEEGGRYYWMADGEWLTDSSGNRIEIRPETPLPQFRVSDGRLEVSVDGGKSFKPLGKVDKCLINSVTEDAVKIVFTLSGGSQVIIPKPQALRLTLEGDGKTIGAGESITAAYRVEGAENVTLTALCGDGWSVEITAADASTGTIKVTAPSPIAEDKVIVFASDGKGRMVAVRMRLTVDTSGNPDPPVEDPVLQPVITAYDVTKEGGEIVAGLVTNLDYEVTASAGWLIYQGTRAVRTDNLAFYVQPNDDVARAAVARITSGIYSTAIAFSQAGEARVLELSATRMNFGVDGGSKNLTVTSNIDYNYEVSDEWVSMEHSSVTSYVITVPANTAARDRTATVTFSGDRVQTRILEINQSAQAPYLTVSGGPFSFGAGGGSGTVTVLSNIDVSCSISGGDGWLVLTGVDDGRYNLSVPRNGNFEERTATITFSGDGVEPQSVTVSQAAEEPYFTLSSASFAFESSGGAEILTISSNIEYSYTVSGDGWLTVSPVGTTGGKYAIMAATNPSVDVRSATITFSGEWMEPRTVTVSQAGQDPFLRVSIGGAIYFGTDGGASGFSVTSNLPYTVTITDGSWLTFSGEPAAGLAFFSVSVPPNMTYVTRTATITFSADGTDSRTVHIVQSASMPPEPPEPGVNVEGDIPPALAGILAMGGNVESLVSNADGMKFIMTDSQTVFFPRSETLSLTLDDSRAITRGGGTVDIRYHIGGVDPANGEIYVSVLFYADGWRATVYPANAAEGTIRLKAPDPASRGIILVMVSDAAGKMAAVQMHLKIEALSSTGPIPVCHIMPCCRVNNAGTSFLVNGRWNSYHQYYYIEDTRSILQQIQAAGINTVCVDFTNPSQWDSAGESAQHNGDGGEFWYQFKPMLDNIVEVCEEMDMEFIIFLGNPLAAISDLSYWNKIAGRVLDNWAKSPAYRRYGYGDDRPLAVMFCPGTNYASLISRAKASDKNNLLQFRMGTCQVNSPITPTSTDGWGYRNYSQSNDGKVRFACPNGGVPPQDWYRVDAEEWRRRVDWVMGAAEYAVIGSYDDTCDAIFWGIADVSRSATPYHRNETTEGDPYIYYEIVSKKLLSL